MVRWTLAATVLLALGAMLGITLLGGPRWQTFVTAVGEQRAFSLDDGSFVHLNTDSRIAVRLGPERREVRLLRGEALFRVHHETARPFLVATDAAVVRAVGTEFDVYRREDVTVVAVLEGRVNVTAVPEPHLLAGDSAPRALRTLATRSLSASEQARVSPAGAMSVEHLGHVGDAVAWRERRLVFQQETLAGIVREFNRYRPTPIRLEDAAVAERIYSGVFDADDADSLLAVLEHDPALAVERRPGDIHIRLRAAPGAAQGPGSAPAALALPSGSAVAQARGSSAAVANR